MSYSASAGVPDVQAGFLDLARIVARPGFNRWLVPPAALAIHLCIGMAYGFSVFWLPLSQAIGITAPVACPADSGVLIQKVIAGGAAERAGLRGGNQQAYVGNTPIMLGGDLIVGIDGQEVTDPQDISAIMDKHQAGDTISVTVLRGQRKLTVKLVLGEARDATT